jgi:hypothetical protein
MPFVSQKQRRYAYWKNSEAKKHHKTPPFDIEEWETGVSRHLPIYVGGDFNIKIKKYKPPANLISDELAEQVMKLMKQYEERNKEKGRKEKEEPKKHKKHKEHKEYKEREVHPSDFSQMNKKELREQCRKYKIPYYGSMNNEGMVQALLKTLRAVPKK